MMGVHKEVFNQKIQFTAPSSGIWQSKSTKYRDFPYLVLFPLLLPFLKILVANL